MTKVKFNKDRCWHITNPRGLEVNHIPGLASVAHDKRGHNPLLPWKKNPISRQYGVEVVNIIVHTREHI